MIVEFLDRKLFGQRVKHMNDHIAVEITQRVTGHPLHRAALAHLSDPHPRKVCDAARMSALALIDAYFALRYADLIGASQHFAKWWRAQDGINSADLDALADEIEKAWPLEGVT